MDNKYFVKFTIPDSELDALDEPVLLAQIMFWAHALDKILIQASNGAFQDISGKLKLLDVRLDAYKRKYGENCAAYQWAIEIRQICEKYQNSNANYSYPFKDKDMPIIKQDEFDSLIKGRRSIRDYTGEDVSDDLINKILEYASWAPSSCHEQALRYIVIKNKEFKSNFKRSGVDVENSAAIIVVLADLRLYSDSDMECTCHDSGAAIQNLLLACHFYGIGACYLSDTSMDSENIHKALSLKEYEKVTAMITIGHYGKSPVTPARIEIDKLVRYF